ncbi:MAG TPA: adenosylcobinamide amidohydrolase [Methylomirabilota bacterium]|jgi:iron complex transport system ATP-binding protein
MIEGVEVAIDREAVVVTAREPLTVLSSAFIGGGLGTARAIVNLHVRTNIPETETDGLLPRFVERREIRGPWIGLLTSAWTEKAVVAEAEGSGLTARAVVTVGLSNRITAGRTPIGVWAPTTINAIVVVDGDPEPAALVNAVMTVTEVKTSLLAAVDLRCDDGRVASGTSTDAVVVAATGRGPRRRFGGPISDLGWVIARAAHDALDVGIRRWIEEHR